MTAPPRPSEPPRDAELLDAWVDRAIGRAATAVAVGTAALAVMAALFVVLADGSLDAGTGPQVWSLTAGVALGLVVGGALHGLLRRLRAATDADRVGIGPTVAASAVTWLNRLVVGAPVVATLGSAGYLLASGALSGGRTTTVLLSCAVGIAVVAQLGVLGALQRVPLRRAARSA
ncbi:hypothetical protein [Thalassiella azotivora]